MLGEHGSSTLKCILAVVEEHKRATSFFALQLGAVTETEI
jgi:hypothetical protein